MRGSETISADAIVILQELLDGRRGAGPTHPEIRVSFRENRGVVGRRDFATHWIHWYPAKMFHRIPSAILGAVELPEGAVVLDPFCGSGTVLLEANLSGHDAVGIDINPLAQLISRVKTTLVDPEPLRMQCEEIVKKAIQSRSQPVPEPTLDSWLSPEARIGLHRLWLSVSDITDSNCQSFFLVSLTSIIRRISRADPAIPPLVRLREERAALGGTRYRKALDKSLSTTAFSVYEAFLQAATENIRRMAELYSLKKQLGHTRVVGGGASAAHTSLDPESVDLIITSPPYCGSQKYVRTTKLELIILGCSPEEIKRLDRQTMGTEAVTTRASALSELLTGDRYVDSFVRPIYERNRVRARIVSDYSKHLSEFATECRRVLRPGGNLIVTLGRSNLAGVTFPADRLFLRLAVGLGLEHIATLVDAIPSRGLLTKRHKTAGRIDSEFIVWLRRPGSRSLDTETPNVN